jgi:PKD domain/PASTA domain
LGLGAVAIVFSLAWAGSALGKTFCVSAPGCSGTNKPGVQQALDAAKASSGADVIKVGPGTYHGPFTDDFGNVVTLVGAGDRTVFVGPSGSAFGSALSTLQISQGTSVFSSFAVVVPAGSAGVGIVSSGTVDHVLVKDVASDFADEGVLDFGSLLHSRVILAGVPSGAAPPEGIVVGGFVQDTLVHMLSPGARGVEPSTATGSGEIRQVTLVGPGDSPTAPPDTTSSRGVSVDPFSPAGNSSAAITLDGVVIRGFAHSLAANGSQSQNFTCGQITCPPFNDFATIFVSYSDFNPATEMLGPADSTISPGSGDLNVDPGFKNPGAGDYSLRRGSSVIDKGNSAVPRPANGPEPADSATDLAGNPRKSDGDGDGTAVVDMGAFEYTNHPPVAVISGPARAMVRRVVHFKGASSHDPDGDSIKFLWSFGDGNQSTAINPAHTYAKPATYTVRLVVTDALSAHSTPATKRIRITPPCVVPRLAGKTVSAAKRALSHAHCTLGQVSRAHSGKVASGRVISSTPGAGTHLRTGAPVALTVSRGR